MSTAIQNNAMRQVKTHNDSKQASAARLASGNHINKASEGAAELSASTGLMATLRASSAATSNATRGLALGQVADGAMSQITDLLLRMKELTVSANSSTFGPDDKAAGQKEYDKLAESITNIANTTRYSGEVLLASVVNIKIQTGELSTDITEFDTKDLTAGALAIEGQDLSGGAAAAGDAVDAAIKTLAAARADVGAFMRGLESTISVNEVKNENLEAAVSVFMEADLAKEATNLAMADIRSQMAQAMITKENQAASNITGLVR